MTRRIGNIVIIDEEPPDTCDLCGKVDELRPYGPKGKRVCFACAQKNPKAMKQGVQRMFGGK